MGITKENAAMNALNCALKDTLKSMSPEGTLQVARTYSFYLTENVECNLSFRPTEGEGN